MEGKTIHGLVGPGRAHTAYRLSLAYKRPVLLVTYNEIESVRLYQDLSSFTKVSRLPSANLQLLEASIADRNTGRVQALCNALQGDSIVASIDAVLPYLAPGDLFASMVIPLTVNTVMELNDLSRRLVAIGYTRVDMVDGYGQFAIRGDIVDIGFAQNVRIEFFDNQVYAIKQLDLETQRSGEKLERIDVYPVTSVPCRDYTRLYGALKAEYDRIGGNIAPAAVKMKSRIERYMDGLKNGTPFYDMDHFAYSLYDQPGTILSYLDHPLVILDEPEKIRERLQDFLTAFEEKYAGHFEKGQALIFHQNCYNREFLQQLPDDTLRFSPFYDQHTPNVIPCKNIYLKTGNGMEFFDYLRESDGQKTYVFCGSEKRANRFVEMLAGQNIAARYLPAYGDISPGEIVCLPQPLSGSVAYPEEKLRLISDREHSAKKPAKSAKMDVFVDLEPGCYVVHETHGIGQYLGVRTVTTLDKSRDYILIAYDKGDKLYLPTEQMDKVQKYIGAGEAKPRLSKLGGRDWDKVKSRVKKSVADMAEDLVKLYAKRTSKAGYAFSQDTPWQQEFEEGFQYEETEDQLISAREIKYDMESNVIMDRLLCGDVGYGKTEVALRAMFKCVMDGKQAALLVPTTLLCRQHYHTIVDRMKGYPVRVGVLSRLSSPAEQKETLAKLKSGELDIVVGTHKLLGKQVKFHDLGLLVVDEEQRFGVAHKEQIKSLKTSVDVLTLSATPIPRTLYMSLIGIRDMSVINTPPGRRQTVATYVMEYSHDLAVDAIMDEINRGGQVYFVYNHVRDIERIAAELQKRLPGVRFGIGHGQMNKLELEQVMLDFYAGDIDVLVCSTIIESGLDVENANTIIVYDADRFGLAQLYQIRGRVGRSDRQAYAYFTYRGTLSEVALKRLSAIRDFTEFGSGFKIAMRDLEIRGAGNILGAEQCGHLTQVGYDMYCRLVNDAVNRIRGVEEQPEIETTLKLDVDAFIPKGYIEKESTKIDVYKRIAEIRDEHQRAAYTQELEDRFGKLPGSVKRLLNIAVLKSRAKAAGFREITKKPFGYMFIFADQVQVDSEKLLSLCKSFPLTFGNGRPYSLILNLPETEDDQVLNGLSRFVQAILD